MLRLFQRDEGIVRLSSCFQWRDFEGDDQRQYIHQEFVYENVMYSVQRGLPWAAVAQIANLSKELLPELRGLERSEALSLIQTRLSQCDQRLPRSHHATVYDFMVQTYIHHQCLYQAFLKEEVKPKCMHSHLEIQVPPHPLPLSEGTDLGVWEKQQALKELMAAETVKLAEIHKLKEQAEAQIMEKSQVILSNLSLEDRLDKQALESMVQLLSAVGSRHGKGDFNEGNQSCTRAAGNKTESNSSTRSRTPFRCIRLLTKRLYVWLH
ncbi:hypothetical protein PHYPO_G00014910 [Pangasianodon hypophthalmus]|uniref:Uncharacterized protein n=1 Tax=Pangasianodon hypophthalmus TaxID=310915 RepID=A0A5N5N3Q2_PANHP|nr:hypothetical protein PHYPO_G00014910 [Pangasianodon hypophthalmus]